MPIRLTIRQNRTAASVAAKFEGLDERLRAELLWAIEQATSQLKDRVLRHLGGETLKMVSGRLFASIQDEVVSEGDIVRGRVYTRGVPYARVQEYGGRSPYEIVPTKALALRFLAKSGEVVYAKQVLHPALEARSYMRASLIELWPQIHAEIKAAVARARR